MEKKFENRPNSGVLFSVRAKKTPKSPDYSGEILVDLKTLKEENGMVLVKLSGWKKQSQAGTSFLSLSVNTYKPQQQQQADDPDVPF